MRLDWPPEPGTPLLVGGTGPRTLELAGRVGDGILIGSVTSEAELADSVAAARGGWVAAAGRRRPDAGRHPPDGGDRPGLPSSGSPTSCDGGTAPTARPAEEWPATRQAVADAVRRLAEIGATSVVFQPTEDEPDLEGFVEFVGRDVRAALLR